jgi:predicted lipase
MTQAYPANATGRENDNAEGGATALGIARWLSLAAAPTFAIMALLTGVLGGGPMDMLCSAGHGSPLAGMVPMYLLMAAFHSATWLRLVANRRAALADLNEELKS